MNISPAEAIRQFNVSKPTLYSDMKDGKLSYSLDDRKRRKINISELDRIYQKREGDNKGSSNSTVNLTPGNTQSDVNSAALEKEIEYLKREVQSKEQETEKWQAAFDKAQATADKITALLTDKTQEKDSGAGEWDKSLKTLENRISNQEKTAKDTAEKEQKIIRQNRALKKALDEERNKSFFKKLFG